MRLRFFAVLLIAGVGASSQRVRADFQWTSSWQATPTGTGSSSFQPLPDFPNEGAFQATAMSSIQLNTGPPIVFSDTGPAGSTIVRTFSLSGSPNGWNVNVSCGFSGTHNGLHGGAEAHLTGSINSLNVLTHNLNVSGGGINIPFNQFSDNDFAFSDGLYTLNIQNIADTFLAPPPLQGPVNFGSINEQVSFTIRFTPVPEPALLGGLASLALLGLFTRRA